MKSKDIINKINFPPRDRLLVKQALKSINTISRWWEYVEVFNPNSTTKRGEPIAKTQTIDFIVANKKGIIFGLEFSPYWGTSGPHKFQKQWHAEKRLLMQEREIPLLVIRRGESTYSYTSKIYLFDRKITRALALKKEAEASERL